MPTNTCRTCGRVEPYEMQTFLTDLVCENTTYEKQVESMIGLTLKDESGFPQKICNLCKTQLELITTVSAIWRGNEQALNGPSTSSAVTPPNVGILKTPKVNQRKRAKSESVDHTFFFYEKNPEGMSSALQKKTKSYTSLNKVKDLFSRELAFMDVLKDLDMYAHIQVEKEHILESGQISDKFLQKFEATKTWTQFMYHCDHCNEEILGLLAFMDHKRGEGIKIYKIKCVEAECPREFSALYSYINHCATDHDAHLAFSCVFCVPSRVFYNIPCLLNHYLDSHSDMNFSFFMCIECGMFTQSIKQLHTHKMSKHDKVQEIDENSDDSESSDEEGARRKKQSRFSDIDWTPLNAMAPRQFKSTMNLKAKSIIPKKSTSTANLSAAATPSSLNEQKPQFHQKVRDTQNRQTFPCTVEGCNRTLVTAAGYAYHLLTHTGEKPFPCRYCTARFRSQATADSHERTQHLT